MSKPISILAGIVLIILAVVAFSGLYSVRENQQALVVQFGEPRRVVTEPGLHFKLPIIQQVSYFEKRLLDYDAASQEIPTVDQRQLIVDAYARYRIVDPLRFYQSVNNEIRMNQQLGSIIDRALRDSLGRVGQSALLSSRRTEIMSEFTKQVAEQSRGFGIEVVDVRLKRVDLPEANSQAVFRRMQTQREQEARKIRAEGDRDAQRIRADAEKQARVIEAEARKTAEIQRGEGDAEATRIYNVAYSKDEAFFDFFRSMQAMTKGLASDSTTYVGPPSGDFFRFFENETGAAPANAGR